MDIEYANNAMKKVLEDPRLIAREARGHSQDAHSSHV